MNVNELTFILYRFHTLFLLPNPDKYIYKDLKTLKYDVASMHKATVKYFDR